MPGDIHPEDKIYPTQTYKKLTKPSLSGELSDRHITDIIIDALKSDTQHPSADIEYNQKYYQLLCKKHQHICQMIHYTGNPSWQQKIRYLAMIVYSIQHIDRYLTSELKLQDIISHITINVDNMGRRGLAGKTVVEFNMGKIKSNKEFLGVISHEFNHIVDLGVLEWTLSRLDYNYTEFGKAHFMVDDPSIDFYKLSRDNEKTLKSGVWYEDFVSGYGLTDPFEDFSETANLYLYHNTMFRQMIVSNPVLSQKFAYMENLYNTQIISKGTITSDLQNDISRRPWDTTKVWISQ